MTDATTTLPSLPTRYARLVKIEHTVFALPFAYVGAFLAVDGVPSAHDLFWVTVAMVGARSLAMALNRLIDAEIDAKNPRTATREIPAGHLGVGAVVAFCAASLFVFMVAVWQLAPITRWLAPIPVIAFVVYPYLKRVTWLCHVWLGAAVAAWVAGFDCFYALFDLDVDRQQGLHSVATRFGERGAFLGARVLHVLTVVLLAVTGLGLSVGWAYWLGVLCVALLLGYEHSLVRPGDLRRLDAAFFTMNGVISVAFAVFVLIDVL